MRLARVSFSDAALSTSNLQTIHAPPKQELRLHGLKILLCSSLIGCSRVSSSLSGPVVPLFLALARRLNFTDRRHKFDKYFLSLFSPEKLVSTQVVVTTAGPFHRLF